MPADIEKTIKAAIAYARELISLCSTTTAINSNAPAQKKKTTKLVRRAQLRQLELTCYSIDTCPTALILRHYDDIVRHTSAGNCQEYALLVFAYLCKHHPSIHAEVFYIQKGDHAVVVINRAKGSNLLKPEKWGDGCYVIDAWDGTFHKGKSYRTKLRNYQREIRSSTFFNRVHELTAGQHLVPLPGFCSEVIALLNEPVSVKQLYTNFNDKFALLIQCQQDIQAEIARHPKNSPHYEELICTFNAMTASTEALLIIALPAATDLTKLTAADFNKPSFNPAKSFCEAADKESYLDCSEYLTSLLRSLTQLMLRACGYKKAELIDLHASTSALLTMSSLDISTEAKPGIETLRALGLRFVYDLKMQLPKLLTITFNQEEASYSIGGEPYPPFLKLDYGTCIQIVETDSSDEDAEWCRQYREATETDIRALMRTCR